jgi:hypothetical protein
MGARRRVLRLARATERRGVALELIGDRKAHKVLAEDRHEAEVGVVQRVEALIEDATEWLEQADVLEPPIAVGRKPAELGEHAFTGRLRHERARGAEERLRALVHPEPELVLEANRAQEPVRIVDEDRVRDRADDAGAKVAAPVVRVVRLPGLDALGDRVEREVPRREVRIEPVLERREVHRLVDPGGDDAPCAVSLGEGEDGAPEPLREPVRSVARVGAGHIDVEHGAQEELVPNGTTDDPGVLPAQDLAETLIHRRRPAERDPSAC